MARKLRLQYPGAIYHVMNRGDRREPIFKDDQDRRRFFETLGEACAKTGWQVHAYCLMSNHFHLVVETPKGNLVAGMKWFLGTYTSRFNRRHQLFGHLFSGRYKSLIVDGSGDGYLRTVCDYVHLNPVRAKLIRPAQSLRAYPWSSYPEYLKRPSQRVGWLRVDRVLGELGIQCDDAAGRRRFAEAMEERRGQDPPGEWQAVRRGWFLGSGFVKEQLLERMGSALGTHHGGKVSANSTIAGTDTFLARWDSNSVSVDASVTSKSRCSFSRISLTNARKSEESSTFRMRIGLPDCG